VIRGPRTISVTTSLGRLPWRWSVQLVDANSTGPSPRRSRSSATRKSKRPARSWRRTTTRPAWSSRPSRPTAWRAPRGEAGPPRDEAGALFRRALALLADLAPAPDRDALELDVRIALGSPLVAIEGYGSKGAHQLYERALSLCRKLHRRVDPPILRGLGLARLQGCHFDACEELARDLLDDESHGPIARTEGAYLRGVSVFWRR